MNISISTNNGRAVITVSEDAAHDDYAKIAPAVEQAGQLSEICLDLKGMFYITSAQIAELVAVAKLGNSKKTPVVLLNVNPGVYESLELANLLGQFAFRQDYSCYTLAELIDMFNNPENASDVSDYFVSHYTGDVKKALTANIQSLDFDNPIVQEYSLITIGRAYDDAAIDNIRNCLNSQYPNVVHSTILVLGWLGDMSSKEKIYSFLTSNTIELADAAGASIALLSDDDDTAKLAKLAESGSNTLRMIIAGILALINGNEAFAVLSAMFAKEKDDEVRKMLTRYLSYFNKPEATDTLIKLLDDSSKAVQEAAAAGLERTGLRGHEDVVLKKVAVGGMISYFAVKALGKTCSDASATALIGLYDKIEPITKLAVLEALGHCSGDTVKDFLLKRLSDQNEDIRKEALSSLGKQFKGVAAAEAEKMIRGDASWQVRYQALEILEEIRPANFAAILKDIKQKDDNRYIQEKVSELLGM
ncbi:MAG: HEAT repeat domain-containing protein [Deferribacteraceae bacterium]|jgi:HEAT repeat protein/anti-anti-sigma regulatory factor|nr:HEAT repeat domain-containing protein [Deferribacteraceae bacterium]